MRLQTKILLAAALVLASAAPPAIALGRCVGCGPAPGPVAGAGIGFLAAAGGYYLYRRWRKQNTKD